MTKMDYLKLLVDEIHSTTVATIGSDGHPQTRIIDMMYYDEEGVYFLTAKGKAFYDQLMEQQYVAISATKEKNSLKEIYQKFQDRISNTWQPKKSIRQFPFQNLSSVTPFPS